MAANCACMRAGECPKQNYFPSTTVPRADTTSLKAASLHAACMAYAPCPGRGGYVTGGGEGENDGVRSHVCFQKAGAMAGEAEGCRTGCKQQQGTISCVWCAKSYKCPKRSTADEENKRQSSLYCMGCLSHPEVNMFQCWRKGRAGL